MKKSLLALAVAAVAASSVASAATVYDQDGTSMAIYGRIQGVVYSQDTGMSKVANAAGDSSLQGSGRLGFNLRTPLTEGIAAFANAEWEMADHKQRTNDNFKSRYMWVGADFGQYGQLKAGRFEDAVKYVVKTTDIFDDWGCNGQLDNDDKRDGMFQYSWSGYGVDFNATYGTAKDNQQVDGAWLASAGETLDIKNSYAVSAGYTSPDVLFGPIAVKAGYGYARFQDDRNLSNAATASYDNYKQLAAALSWGSLNVGPYVAAVYSNRDFTMNGTTDDYAVQGAEFVVAYGFENGVSLRTGYEWMNFDQDNGADVDAYTVPVYVNYKVTPNFNVWGEARFDANTDDGAKGFKAVTGQNFEENVYSVGARYTF